MKYNLPEWWAIIVGCISAIIVGAASPLYAIVFGNFIGVLSNSDSEYVERIGIIITAVANTFQTYMFGIAGEKLTMRLRSFMFKSFLSQEIGYFDDKENGVGALCARLSGEAAAVQGATGQRIATILTSISTVVIVLVTSVYFEWRIGLVCLCFSPFVVLAAYFEKKMIGKESQDLYKCLQRSTKIAVEAINGIRTVTSLGCEKIFHDFYMAELTPYQQMAQRNTHVRGLVYGLSRSLAFFVYSAAFYYGSVLIKNEHIDYSIIFIVSQSMMNCSWSLSNSFAFAPNFHRSLIAANRIFTLLNRIPLVLDGSTNDKERWEKGNIEYKKIHFAYPSRRNIAVLKGLDLSVTQGKVVALVGPSGCGKSTIVQLLERFYDPVRGNVLVDDKGIDTMHLSALSQEPNLFSMTIAENIAYGDNTRLVSENEILEAAKKANIHTFVHSLPLGYDTKLGDKGTQLSGGQKQRIAIARALIRNPMILLLDEATSALDSESEKIVQEALDSIKKGPTCITIAHRLTTIEDADTICTINNGVVAEMGTHSELLALKGIYYDLHNLIH